jgi:hypothetical protein
MTATYIDTSSTFASNMKLPVHRWFRYSAGFSAEWVKKVISELIVEGNPTLFDPFAGSGTAVLAAQECGVTAIGIESHPFVFRVAKAKLLWHVNTDSFSRFSGLVLSIASRQGGDTRGYPKLIYDCFPEAVLSDLDALKRAWLQQNDDSHSSILSWLALTKILRECSPVGTSQMELIQPKKIKQRPLKPFEAFAGQVASMRADMEYIQGRNINEPAAIYQDDARTCNSIATDSIKLVITSPPYINNFDYADATRLEMSFWDEVTGWGDLQEKVRQFLIRSCAQHMSYQKQSLMDILKSGRLLPIIDDLLPVCTALSEERLRHGGKKNYHLMIAAYFSDMAEVWTQLRRVCCRPSRLCFVVGDSAPYGVYVPVHEWLGRLAIAAGFSEFRFIKSRDRNTKWQNRKHKVPLCEGRLWVEG